MHKARPPPLPDSCSLSLVDNLQFCRMHPTQTPCWSLSLSLCVWGGGVFLVRMHIYSIYRSLLHTMYDSLVQAKYLGCTHVRTQISWLVARNSLTHHSTISELFPLSQTLHLPGSHIHMHISLALDRPI